MNIWQALSAAMTLGGLFWTVVILGISTFLHELAHYLAARKQGVDVPFFSIGMGPVLWRKQWRGTEWRLSALPIGGYVNIAGMAPNEDGSAPTHGFARLSPWGKIFVFVIAPLTNIALAFVLLTGLYTSQGLNTPVNNQIQLAQVLPASRAQALGLQAGDIITAINAQPLPDSYGPQHTPGWQKLAEVLQRSGPHRLTVQRAGQTLNVAFDWQAKVNGVQQKLGVAYGPVLQRTPLNVGQAAVQAGKDIVGAVPRTLSAISTLFVRLLSFNVQPDNGVVGPIGTAQAVSQASKLGVVALLSMFMAVNLGLGLMNLLPIPGLDGGHTLLVLLGMLRGRPLSMESYQRVTLSGFALLLLLGLFTFVRDVVRLAQ